MKSGFTLIELLTALCLSLMIILLVGGLVPRLFRSQLQQTVHTGEVIRLCIALQVISQDCKQLSGVTIKARSTTGCVITCDTTDIGWHFQKGLLRRYVGRYDVLSDSWHLTSPSKLLGELTGVTFSYKVVQGTVHGITCKVMSKHASLTRYVGIV